MVDAGVNQIDRTDQVVVVVESLDEMAEPLRSVRRQMVDIVKRILFKDAVDELMIQDGPLQKSAPLRRVVRKTATHIVEDDDIMAVPDQMFGNMRAHESCSSGYE